MGFEPTIFVSPVASRQSPAWRFNSLDHKGTWVRGAEIGVLLRLVLACLFDSVHIKGLKFDACVEREKSKIGGIVKILFFYISRFDGNIDYTIVKTYGSAHYTIDSSMHL